MAVWDLVLLYFRVLSNWVPTIIVTCVIWIPVTALLGYLLRVWVRWRRRFLLPHLQVVGDKGEQPVLVGLFHPYCNAGGGGERVLWVAVRALQNRYPHAQCVIYTGDIDVTADDIIQKARDRFNIVLPRAVEFVFLRRRNWVEANPYPYFTLLGQSLGSLVLGWEALMKFVPDIYLDTMGYAFTIPLFKYLGGCKVGCYVHYPTISTDMLEKVSQRSIGTNNASFISRSPMLTSVKLCYYRLFAYIYGLAGKRCDIIMVNSSWTQGHILQLWQAGSKTHIVYPPCDTKEFLKIPLTDSQNKKHLSVVSVAQFRPEKDHPLQIQAFHDFLEKRAEEEKNRYRLVLVGSCRNEEDSARVAQLKQQCEDLNMSDFVEFKLNVPFEELKENLADATIGLHTMWNEHFGIGIVECMAAGSIVLAHDSGGPKLDIVVDYNGSKTGYLADSAQSYADAMDAIFKLSDEEQVDIKLNARESVTRFSEQQFESGFLSATEPLFQK